MKYESATLIIISWSSVQSSDSATPWTTACQASLSITNSWSLPKLMSIESVMPSNHLISVIPFSSCPQSLPASGSFQMSQLFTSGGQNTGVSASASVLPMNTQDWFPLGWTGWISLQSKGLSYKIKSIFKKFHHYKYSHPSSIHWGWFQDSHPHRHCSPRMLVPKISSVQLLSRVRLLQPHGLQHAKLPCQSGFLVKGETMDTEPWQSADLYLDSSV